MGYLLDITNPTGRELEVYLRNKFIIPAKESGCWYEGERIETHEQTFSIKSGDKVWVINRIDREKSKKGEIKYIVNGIIVIELECGKEIEMHRYQALGGLEFRS